MRINVPPAPPPVGRARQCPSCAPGRRRASMSLPPPPVGRTPMPQLFHRGGAHRRSWAPPHLADRLWRGTVGTSMLLLVQPKGGFAGDMLPRCVIGRSGMAAYAREMHSQAPGGGDMLTLCVPRCLAAAIFCPDVSQKRPRTGKRPLRGNISPPCIQK